MKRGSPRTRRALLSAIGASTVGLAGCSLGPEGGNDDGTQRTNSDPPNGDGSDGSSGSHTETATPLPDLEPSEVIDADAIEAGGRSQFAEPPNDSAVLATFDRFDENWTVTAGRAAAQSDAVYHGDQSILMDSTGTSRVQIERTFTSFRDFNDLDFSIAVCVLGTSRGAINPYLTLKDVNGNHRIYSGQVSSLAPNRWVRVDFGLETDKGIDMSIVDSVAIGEYVGDRESQFIVDDLQVREKPRRGQVILSFEDSHKLDYEYAFPLLRNYGIDGTIFAPAASMSDSQDPTLEEFQEMAEAGWEVGAHSMKHERLPNYSREEQRQILEENMTYLEANGFEEGMHHFRTTKGAYDTNTLDIVRDLFKTMYVPQGRASGTAVRATDPHTIGFSSGDDYEKAKEYVDRAVEHRQFLGLSFHMRNLEDRETFEGLIDHVNQHVRRGNLSVVTPSEHYRRYVE